MVLKFWNPRFEFMVLIDWNRINCLDGLKVDSFSLFGMRSQQMISRLEYFMSI